MYSSLHWTDKKSGNPEKAGKMASLIWLEHLLGLAAGWLCGR